MKTFISGLAICLIALTLFFSCTKRDQSSTEKEDIPSDVIKKLQAQGFNTQHVIRSKNGYIVEGDIFLTAEKIDQAATLQKLHVANTEQYRTTNLITGLPRVITISVTNLPPAYTTATDAAIARYNALNLRLTFQRVAANGNIDIAGGIFNDPNVLGQSAGFPDVNGTPPSPILLNANSIGNTPDQGYITTIIAHEIGHCIGFRHTDYFNRTYSCGWGGNEGDAGVGAVNIPGTPTAEDPNSWMLACTSGGDRPFNANDVIALNYLYGAPPPCVGEGKKLINGICRTGTKIITDVQNSSVGGHARCKRTYHYKWSDGSVSGDYFEYFNGVCAVLP